MSYVPDIVIEDSMELCQDVEAEERLSEEERKVLAEIREEKERVLERIKVFFLDLKTILSLMYPLKADL